MMSTEKISLVARLQTKNPLVHALPCEGWNTNTETTFSPIETRKISPWKSRTPGHCSCRWQSVQLLVHEVHHLRARKPKAVCYLSKDNSSAYTHFHVQHVSSDCERICRQSPENMLSLVARLQTKNPLEVFDHQIHQKLATDIIGVSFDAQWYEVFGYRHGKCVRVLGWSST